MEEHTILSERLEDQIKVVEWAREEQKRLLKEKGEELSKALAEKMTPFILNQEKIESVFKTELALCEWIRQKCQLLISENNP
jgi:hypothetical protein